VRPPPPFVMSPDQITPAILAQLEAKLLALLPADGSTMGNGAAAKALGMGDAIYDLVKGSLHTKGKLDKGQGRGGSIRLAGVAKDEFFDPKEVTSVAPLNLNAPGGKAPKAPKGEAPAVPFTQHRHADATRKNLPPAGGDAQQEVGHEQKIVYAFDPHRSPELRFNGQIGRLKDLLVKATQEKLSAEEAAEFAKLIESEQPWLEWAGKRENPNFSVDPVALHIHERVSAEAILRAIRREDIQRDMFLTSQLSPREAKAYYKHDEAWTNRLILGDSLQVMTSLAKRENLAGQVQMIYIDPPYGINYSSNWQNEVGSRDVKNSDNDLTREPEMIRAYRDTWLLGVHSYLQYMKQRLVSARELLTDEGSCFVQISDDNLHRVRLLMDEVFGPENFQALITYRTSVPLKSKTLAGICDFVIWYSKNSKKVKRYDLFQERSEGEGSIYNNLDFENGERRPIRDTDRDLNGSLPASARLFGTDNLVSSGYTTTCIFQTEYEGRLFTPSSGKSWKTNEEGMRRLKLARRVNASGKTLRAMMFMDDYPVQKMTALWTDTKGESDKTYVVQTAAKVIQRCMLMSTDAGDLVLDPTCGSGSTAYVAEQWGRRWITVDTSRVALAVARQRLLTSTFEAFKTNDPTAGVDPTAPLNPKWGFAYRTVPHVTLKSISQNAGLDPIFEKHESILDKKLDELNRALNSAGEEVVALAMKKVELRRRDYVAGISAKDGWHRWEVPYQAELAWPAELKHSLREYHEAFKAKMEEVNAAIAASAEQEELVDQPIVIKGVTRVTGPFTVESVRPPEISADPAKPDAADGSPIGGAPAGNLPTFEPEEERNLSAHVDRMLSLLKQDGITFLGNKHISLTRLDRADHPMIHGEGEYTPEGATEPRKVAIVIGPEHGAVPLFFVEEAMRISYKRGYDDLVIAGFSFDAFAQECIQTNNEDKKIKLTMHMAQIRPDVTMGDLLKKTNNNNQIFTVFGQPRSRVESVEGGGFRATLEGVDIYDPVANQIVSSGAEKVAAWFIDTDYDGKVFCVCQAFFPDKSAWEKLQRALKATIAEEKWGELTGKVSLPFKKGKTGLVAVKVIDPRGNEVMRIHRLA
jgi:adenine-specific DNA-methyltransferase